MLRQTMHPSAATANFALLFLPEVRTFMKGTPSEDHTTPPSARTASSSRFVGGGAPGVRPFPGWLIPRRSHTLAWSHLGNRRLSLLPASVRVTCARISSRTARRSAPAFAGLKAWPVGAHAAPVVLGISVAQRLEPPLVLLNQFRVARRGASCARPAVVVPLPLEVGPWVGASAACSC